MNTFPSISDRVTDSVPSSSVEKKQNPTERAQGQKKAIIKYYQDFAQRVLDTGEEALQKSKILFENRPRYPKNSSEEKK